MFFMSSMAERRLSERTLAAVRSAASTAAARAIISEALPALVLPALSTSDLDRIRLHLLNLPSDQVQARVQWQDLAGSSAVFLLVFLLTFPVVAPFLLVADAATALRISNAIAIALLFATGCALGRLAGRPLRTGFLMVAVGLGMVAVAMALGG